MKSKILTSASRFFRRSFFSTFILVSVIVGIMATDVWSITPNHATSNSKNNSKNSSKDIEKLSYKLSYRGPFTSMVWADLADVQLSFINKSHSRGYLQGHQLMMYLTTERYKKTELLHPVRLKYTATMDDKLSKLQLIEAIDKGASQRHEFLWVDWNSGQTQVFKKRDRQQNTLSGDHSVWEKNGEIPVPAFLQDISKLDTELPATLSYLIHKERGDEVKQSLLLDPISLLYKLRSLDNHDVLKLPLAIRDNIRIYTVNNLGMGVLELNDKTVRAQKLQIFSEHKKQQLYTLWLSNDRYRVPLAMTLDAPFGQLKIILVHKENLKKINFS